ncbi:MAG: hypothetical protein AAFR37_16115 [Cyanobacteria bacterium J06628_3]
MEATTMDKYDDIFKSRGILNESLSSQEAVAAIAILTASADSSFEDVDVEFLVDILWRFEIFEEYSDEDLLEIIEKFINYF